MEQLVNVNPQLFTAPAEEIKSYINTKRWYELGLELLKLFSNEATLGYRMGVFEEIVKDCSLFLDPFHYANLALLVSDEIQDFSHGIDFLNQVLDNKRLDQYPEPRDLIILRIIELHTKNSNFESALQLLNEVEKRIGESTALVVRSSFHKTQANLDKARGDFDAFYEHAFLYLSTSKSTNDPILAYDMCVAALFSSNICSFGELASHPILNSLKGGENQWLYDLIMLLDRGDSSIIPEFEEKFAPIISQTEPFSGYLTTIQQKLALAVFLQIIFKQPFDSRVFTFDEITEGCHLRKDQVELLVMKALSSEIIKGVIDEVEEKITVTWCKPKALSKERLEHLKKEIDKWINIVHKQRLALESRAQPVIG
ncbi:PCI domain containing protein [Histomonas meleagridis]|uniref:PCI domain containing protein n=1 Tax=Histomonas meleagridis TaxID=135588 RepID=UPI00355A6E89|nr:PCI domain containing protein [Histomonas meleagridis]KAH0801532.1 PCI domain containing protein [Histomonas meleagridis]